VVDHHTPKLYHHHQGQDQVVEVLDHHQHIQDKSIQAAHYQFCSPSAIYSPNYDMFYDGHLGKLNKQVVVVLSQLWFDIFYIFGTTSRSGLKIRKEEMD
jgi:hypothetical protein